MGGTGVRGRFSFDIVVALNGNGQIAWNQTEWNRGRDVWNRGHTDFQAGECWFIPAVLTADPWTKTHATLLCAYKPDLAQLRSKLKVERHSEAAIAQTVFD